MAEAVPFPTEHFGAGSADDGILMSTSPEAGYPVVTVAHPKVSLDFRFLRDIGGAFTLVEAGLVTGGIRAASCARLWIMGAICVLSRAPFNIRDVAMSIRGSEVPFRDFLAVTFPVPSLASLSVRSFSHADHR